MPTPDQTSQNAGQQVDPAQMKQQYLQLVSTLVQMGVLSKQEVTQAAAHGDNMTAENAANMSYSSAPSPTPDAGAPTDAGVQADASMGAAPAQDQNAPAQDQNVAAYQQAVTNRYGA